jgi:CII-binding regulator of phage lambda lysogenization HflD
VAQFGSAPALGAGGRRFKSYLSDQYTKKEIIMNEMNEKYLARMLEGAEQGLEQVDMAITQIEDQMKKMAEQREDMVTAVAELKDLLGLDEEKKKPQLLVEEADD